MAASSLASNAKRLYLGVTLGVTIAVQSDKMAKICHLHGIVRFLFPHHLFSTKKAIPQGWPFFVAGPGFVHFALIIDGLKWWC
jgi:hypothetical protein